MCRLEGCEHIHSGTHYYIKPHPQPRFHQSFKRRSSIDGNTRGILFSSFSKRSHVALLEFHKRQNNAYEMSPSLLTSHPQKLLEGGNFLESYVDAAILAHFLSLIGCLRLKMLPETALISAPGARPNSKTFENTVFYLLYA